MAIEYKARTKLKYPKQNCLSLVNAYPAGDQCCDEQTLKEYQRSWNTYIPKYDLHSNTRSPSYENATRHYNYVGHSSPSYVGKNESWNQDYFTYGNFEENSYSTIRPNETRKKRHTYRAGYNNNSGNWDLPVLVYVDIEGGIFNLCFHVFIAKNFLKSYLTLPQKLNSNLIT